MSTYFEHNLENLRSKLLLMGQLANESLRTSIKALINADPVLAKSVREKDEEIDNLENEISEIVTTYLSTHAPVAADLRLLVATLKISHDLERIGDEAKAIARRSRKTALHQFNEIPRMNEIAQEMLQDSLSVFVEFDEAKAKSIWTRDLQVDKLHGENNRFCLNMTEKEPTSATSAFEILFISKSLERIADHAVNISKEVVFMATSVDVRHAAKYKKSVLKKKLAAEG
ncbi:MAG: phosphate transport system regulatory protein PhoU [Euryarchaeota archaeon]|nr:phosphate transport system regulatory protein PhoU [Euryarchaeota archaeon]